MGIYSCYNCGKEFWTLRGQRKHYEKFECPRTPPVIKTGETVHVTGYYFLRTPNCNDTCRPLEAEKRRFFCDGSITNRLMMCNHEAEYEYMRDDNEQR